jgi:CRP/FNR family transcriptional regulator, cyclic AMP receptor protein
VSGSLRLLDVDPDLGAGIGDPDQWARALASVTVAQLRLEGGEMLDVRTLVEDAPHGVLVVEGYVVRELTTAGRTSADLIGPEDLVEPRFAHPAVAVLPHAMSWCAMTPARLAFLDQDFFARAAPWPEISRTLLERATRPGSRLVVHHAIATLPSIDARLLAYLWHLAAYWATVASDGFVLGVPLSHERLARLLGARRPTLTGAVGRLRNAGLLEQREDRSWKLRTPSATELVESTGAGLAIPLLEGMLAPPGLGGRRGRRARNARSRAISARDLHERIAEQRRQLELASVRHQAALTLLRSNADEMRSSTANLSKMTRRTGEIRAQRPPGDGHPQAETNGRTST